MSSIQVVLSLFVTFYTVSCSSSSVIDWCESCKTFVNLVRSNQVNEISESSILQNLYEISRSSDESPEEICFNENICTPDQNVVNRETHIKMISLVDTCKVCRTIMDTINSHLHSRDINDVAAAFTWGCSDVHGVLANVRCYYFLYTRRVEIMHAIFYYPNDSFAACLSLKECVKA